jgi:hypothetical protein
MIRLPCGCIAIWSHGWTVLRKPCAALLWHAASSRIARESEQEETMRQIEIDWQAWGSAGAGIYATPMALAGVR